MIDALGRTGITMPRASAYLQSLADPASTPHPLPAPIAERLQREVTDGAPRHRVRSHRLGERRAARLCGFPQAHLGNALGEGGLPSLRLADCSGGRSRQTQQ